jgi:putative pyruvate formate lyase activating enzyme
MAADSPCQLCPRACGVNRGAGERGACGETAALRVAAAVIHRGEEPPIIGNGGSGAIFISGCNLGCVFCQNYQISQENMGSIVSIEEFARICLKLEGAGAENINIVTGSHAAPAIIAGVKQAQTHGLTIPILWNSSGYESLSTLALLEDVVSVYLPDMKTLDSNLAASFFNAPDYPQHCKNAILRMLDYQGKLRYDGAILKAGVIIRHLVIPGRLDDTRQVLRWFAQHAQGRALFSLMTQYTPIQRSNAAPKVFINEREYETVVGWLEEFDIDAGFVQELNLDLTWLPNFGNENPFDTALSDPIWHWNAVKRV